MKKHTILVVEDDAEHLEWVRGKLQSANYRTLEATNGEDARKLFGNEIPCAIVLDTSLPPDGVNARADVVVGQGLLEYFRNAKPSLPILVFTAHTEAKYADNALSNKASAFLSKDDEENAIPLLDRLRMELLKDGRRVHDECEKRTDSDREAPTTLAEPKAAAATSELKKRSVVPDVRLSIRRQVVGRYGAVSVNSDLVRLPLSSFVVCLLLAEAKLENPDAGCVSKKELDTPLPPEVTWNAAARLRSILAEIARKRSPIVETDEQGGFWIRDGVELDVDWEGLAQNKDEKVKKIASKAMAFLDSVAKP